MRNLAYTIIFIVFVIASQGHTEEYKCYSEIYSIKDTLEIVLISANHCPDPDRSFPFGGFLIYYGAFNEYSKVLWGESWTVSGPTTDYFYWDFDSDGINEVLTLFSDVGLMFGYVHRFKIDSNYSVSIRSFEFSQILIEDVPLSDILRINDDQSITIIGGISAWDEEKKMIYSIHDNPTIYYDVKGDSLAIK